MQRARSQAWKIRYGGFATNYIHIWLAMRSVERLPEDRQRLSVRLFPCLSFICQQNVPLQSRIKWVESSSSEGWWLSNATTRNVNQGQHCAEGTQNTGSNSGEGRKNNKEDAQQLQRPSTWPIRSSKKRSATTEELPEGDGDDGSSGRNPHKKRRLENEKTNPRFACPFFKHNPTKFIGERSCCGPGWINVQRVKEHIFRKHGAPEFQCARCFTDFENDSDLDEHRRNTVACEVRDRPSAPPRVDKGMMQLLKQRKKSTTPVTEMDKWYTVYKIIFPHETQVPSPYYELEEKGLTSPSETTAEEMFQKNLKETLPLEALTNMGLMDLVMPGVMSAFNKTLSALHDQKTTMISEDTQLTTTTIKESWHEVTGRYTMGQSSPQVCNTVKDEPNDLWTPLSHLDSATQGPTHLFSLGSDSMHSEVDTSDSSWQTALNHGFPIDGPSWNLNDDSFNPVVNFAMGVWEPLLDHDYVWGEEASRD
ncbi:hypothetical protein FVEN_g4429 [Fusarium venenatum]|nr:hypothetical protein FVEN_g4429 [Fusarium venenatum]